MQAEEMAELLAEKARVAEEEAALLQKKATDAEEELQKLRAVAIKVGRNKVLDVSSCGNLFLETPFKNSCRVSFALPFCAFSSQTEDDKMAMQRKAKETQKLMGHVVQESETR